MSIRLTAELNLSNKVFFHNDAIEAFLAEQSDLLETLPGDWELEVLGPKAGISIIYLHPTDLTLQRVSSRYNGIVIFSKKYDCPYIQYLDRVEFGNAGYIEIEDERLPDFEAWLRENWKQMPEIWWALSTYASCYLHAGSSHKLESSTELHDAACLLVNKYEAR